MTYKLVPIEQSEEMLRAREAAAVEVADVVRGILRLRTVRRITNFAIDTYLKTLAAAPKPTIPADDREEVARALYEAQNKHFKLNTLEWHELSAFDRNASFVRADAAISTLQSLGWKK